MRLVFRQYALLVCLIVGSLLVHSDPAEANSYLKCLEQSKGQLLTWDSRWDSDRSDNGIVYSVRNVNVINRIPDRIVTLNLVARSKSSRKNRSLEVSTEERARVVCESFTVERRVLSLPGGGSRISSDSADVNLPFIRYTKDGWVRAKKPTRVFDMAICRVHQREFSCLSNEKERFGIMLKTLEEEIRWSDT